MREECKAKPWNFNGVKEFADAMTLQTLSCTKFCVEIGEKVKVKAPQK